MTTPCLFCGELDDAPNHWQRCDGRQGHIEAAVNRGDPIREDLVSRIERAVLEIRAGSAIVGMVRTDDHHTSVAAAVRVEPKRNELHRKVIAAFEARGTMTDEQLERLPEFERYAPSTIRKRRSELYQAHVLEEVGAAKNSRGTTMKVWRAAPGPNARDIHRRPRVRSTARRAGVGGGGPLDPDACEPTWCSAKTPCCERRDEYNGYASGLPSFECPKRCACHD